LVVAGVRIGARDKGQGARDKGQGARDKGQGARDKGQGARDKGQGARVFNGIRDSKKLTQKKREEWFRLLTNCPGVDWAVTTVRPKTIDRINIARAANLGARRVYQKLTRSPSANYGLNRSINFTNSATCLKNSLGAYGAIALLDGGLKLPAYIPQRVFIKGDENIPVISAASIIAKVTRDRIMLRLHKKYPQYGFNLHKGYGTKLHRQMIRKFGRTNVHRASFKL